LKAIKKAAHSNVQLTQMPPTKSIWSHYLIFITIILGIKKAPEDEITSSSGASAQSFPSMVSISVSK
tara:strand:+ start:235 stop:435 length:201 start_codon:yes stop_codon:yes gene_type:complete